VPSDLRLATEAHVRKRQAGVIPRVAVDVHAVTWVQGRDPGFELRSSPGPSSRGGAQVRLPSVAVDPLVGNDPSRPTGGSVRKGVPDLGPGGPRAPMGAAQRENFEHLRGLEAIF